MELRSPIRLYWDISPQPRVAPDYGRISAQVAVSRVLSLNLADLGPSLNHATLLVLRDLSLPQLSLTVSAAALQQALVLPEMEKVQKLLVDCAHAGEVEVAGIALLARSDKPGGISFRVSRGNLADLPTVAAWCERHRVELVLPMERLVTGEESLCLDRQEQAELSGRLAAACSLEALSVTIHDPFLWRIFHPRVPFPDGVCQAANTMLYVDPLGDVYPCPTMPVRLGSLLKQSWHEIVASGDKQEVRRRILALPAACSGCGRQADCRGGCRGRGYAGCKEWDDADPGCGETPGAE
ncbi:MAG: SPASM domain-containing protein [Geobacter sp.]|nr:SPASM domain-containing protein [Geobacter sp.]